LNVKTVKFTARNNGKRMNTLNYKILISALFLTE
jgi:hypothetical protein